MKQSTVVLARPVSNGVNDKPLIIHVITRLEPGGSTQNTLDSAVYQSRYYDVLVLSGPFENSTSQPRRLPQPAGFETGGIKIEIIPELKREISFIDDFKAFRRICRIIKSANPRMVHTHTSKAGMLGRWAVWFCNRRNNGKKIISVHTPHGHVFYGYFGKIKTILFLLLERLSAKITDYFIALTEGEMQESIYFGIGKAEKWQVVHSGIKFQPAEHSDARKQLKIEKDEIVIGTVSRLEPVKGVEYFIRAAEILAKRQAEKKLRFLIVGDGKLKTGLEALAGSAGIADKIIFAGFQEDVYKFLSIMNLYVQPSLNEAMGRTVIQAQFMKIPVIASRVCGIPWVLEDGRTGILVQPADAESIADAAEILLKDENKRTVMANSARKWVMEKDFTGYPKFSLESMNIRLKNFYNKILR